MVILKPLYRIVKAGTYQQAAYNKHYKKKLLMTTFIFKKYDPIKFNKIYIFKLKIVNKIKGKTTNTLFKKLRLVI